MFGWEFPPIKSGGLGTACRDLAKGLCAIDVDITFVMPADTEGISSPYAKLMGTAKLTGKLKIKGVNTVLTPYQTAHGYDEMIHNFDILGTKGEKDIYGKNIYAEVERYTKAALLIAAQEPHDVIHVHDWMTYQAGINARNVSGKPLVAHIHATEFDRTGGNPNQFISHREFEGLQAADVIIANSEYTKQNVIKAYGLDPGKIQVVHWGIEQESPHYGIGQESPFNEEHGTVLFLGRVTIQKGPDWFVETAKKVVDHHPKTKFIMAGNGDMLPRMIDRVTELGLHNHFVFTGFLKGADVHKAFQMADLYVMPSTSEPFGLVALESLKNNTPILISKQSGVSEVVNNALKTDFWNVDDMANKIVSVLRHKELHQELQSNSYQEAFDHCIYKPAQKTKDIYNQVLINSGRNLIGWGG